MLGKILVALLVAAGVFLVYSLFTSGAANAAAAAGGMGSGQSPSPGSAGAADFSKWVTGGQTRTISDPTAKAWTNYAASLPKMSVQQTQSILTGRAKTSSGIGGFLTGK